MQEKRKKCLPPSGEIEGDTAFKTILKKLSASKFKNKKQWTIMLKKIQGSLKYIKNEGNYTDIFIK